MQGQLRVLRNKVRSHDWGSTYTHALIERLEIIKGLVALPLPEMQECLEGLREEDYARAIALCEEFAKPISR